MTAIPKAARKSLAALRRIWHGVLTKNAFGLRGLHVPMLELLRGSGLRRLRLRGQRVEIVEPWWGIRDFIEIFRHELYHFRSTSPSPVIVDCGANVGLSVIYFKLSYPTSQVIAFEPDPSIFEILRRNVGAFGLDEVILWNKAVWVEETVLNFVPSGGVGGHLGTSQHAPTVPVQAVRLAEFLDRPIDMLKIDIEGAERLVLPDCRDVLHNVRNIFLEFHGDPHLPQQLHETLRLLSESGFRYYVQDARGDRRPLDSGWRWQMYDVQVNIFAIRE